MADGVSTVAGNPGAETFGSVLGMMKDIFASGPARFATGFMTFRDRIGQFFGMDPAKSSMMDFVNAAQERAAGNLTSDQLAERGVKDFVNWGITANLEKDGWNPMLASAVASLTSELIGRGAHAFGLTNLAGKALDSSGDLIGNALKAMGVTPSSGDGIPTSGRGPISPSTQVQT